MRRTAWLGLALGLAACGGSSGDIDAGGGADIDAGDTPTADAGPSFDAENCQPPDMLIVLDRTMSMHRRPDGTRPNVAAKMESKLQLRRVMS